MSLNLISVPFGCQILVRTMVHSIVMIPSYSVVWAPMQNPHLCNCGGPTRSAVRSYLVLQKML